MKLGLTTTTRRAQREIEVRSDEASMALDPSEQSSVRPKKERNAVETKRRILEAAQHEFAAKGFDGARLGTIARAAEVQQALIHHYFHDKEGLHAEVVRSGLALITEGVGELIARMDAPSPDAPANKKKKTSEVETLAAAFVDLLLRFFARNESFLSILRHEARRGRDGAGKIVQDIVGPIFEGIVARLDAMREQGIVKKDVDARHLVLSSIAMVAFPFAEQPLVAAIWPADWHGDAFLEERKRQIVQMIVARVTP